jgi:branched-chain amino acid transport system substrate-binding protein
MVIDRKGRRTTVLLASVVSAVVLVAGACSSSKSTSSPPATTAPAGSSATTASSGSAGTTSGSVGATSGAGTATGAWYNEPAKQATGTPFKIGYIYEPGQLLAAPTLTVDALRSWVDWQNAHNGINGHPIDLIVKQDPGNPGLALAAVQSLVGSDHIVALVDGDPNDVAWNSYIQKQPVALFIGGYYSSPTMANSVDQFSTAVNSDYLFDEIMIAAQKVGSKKMAVLYCAEVPACKYTVAPLQSAGQQFGIPVAFTAAVLASAPNYTAQCLAAKQHGATSIFIADGPAVTISVAASCAQQGYTPHQVSDEAAYSQEMAGKPGWDGFLGTQDNIPFNVTSTPGSLVMHNAFNQYEPSVLKSSQYSVGEGILWTTGLLIAAGAEAGGVGTTNPMTGTALQDGVYALHSTNLGGMTPTLTFTRGVPDQNHCWFWIGIQNGQWNLPFGLSTTCAPPLKS